MTGNEEPMKVDHNLYQYLVCLSIRPLSIVPLVPLPLSNRHIQPSATIGSCHFNTSCHKSGSQNSGRVGKCRISVIMTLWPTHTLIHDITTKYKKPTELTKWVVIKKLQVSLTFEDFQFATFSHKTCLVHMTTSEESLRVLFFTRSLTIDLVH